MVSSRPRRRRRLVAGLWLAHELLLLLALGPASPESPANSRAVRCLSRSSLVSFGLAQELRSNVSRLTSQPPDSLAPEASQWWPPPPPWPSGGGEQASHDRSAAHETAGRALGQAEVAPRAVAIRWPHGGGAPEGAVADAEAIEVLCNSRCECLQLKFGARRHNEEAAGPSDKERGLAPAPNASQPSKAATLPPPPPPLLPEGTSKDLERRVHLNQMALIEFGQDYAFDEAQAPPASLDEAELLDEPLEAGSGWQAAGRIPSAALAGGNGDRPTIKLAAGESDQSSGSGRGGPLAARVNAARLQQEAAATIDQSSPPPAFTRMRHNHSGPAPLNGHALLLPSFKPQRGAATAAAASQQAIEGAGGPDKLFGSLHAGQPGARRLHQTLEARGVGQEARPLLERLEPLRPLDLSNQRLGDYSSQAGESRERNLTKLLVESLHSIGQERAQSLVLRNNNIKFELWTQLYSLLLTQMRAHLYRLDLSHNALIKLGVTFTGYIEHHFVYQLMRSNGTDSSWPFSAASQVAQAEAKASATSANSSANSGANSNATTTTRPTTESAGLSNYLQLLNQFKLSGSSTSALPARASGVKRLFRRPLLGDGRLYSAVRLEVPLFESGAGGGGGNHHDNNSSLAQTSWLTGGGRQQLVQTLLHQAARLRALDLSHNKLKWLINDQFRVLKHVQAIRLDHNRIRFIHQQAFNGLAELKYLNLNYNRLQTVYMEQFQTNANLLGLFIKANYLSYLRAGSLAAQANLRRLDLSRNKFAILSNNAFVGLDSLEVLNLSANSFVHVPSAAFHPLLASLKQLDLADNQLAALTPGAFFHLQQLTRLWLHDNDQLASVGRGAFWDLPRLAWLSMRSSSQLLTIEQQAFVGVPQLKTVQLEDCPLLDARSRQLVANITASNTQRDLLLQAKQQAPTTIEPDRARPAVVAATKAGRNELVQDIALATTNASALAPAPATATTATDVEQMNRNDSSNEIARERRTKPTTTTTTTTTTIRTTTAGQGELPPFATTTNNNKPLYLQPAASYQQQYQTQMSIQLQFDQTNATNKITKYFYSLAGLALVFVALKLVFRFGSTRRYLEQRRRRRRVYQTRGQLQPDDHELERGSIASSQLSAKRPESDSFASGSLSSCSSPRPAGRDSFALVEQLPQNVLSAAAPAPVSVTTKRSMQADDETATLDAEDQNEQMHEIDLAGEPGADCQCCAGCLGQHVDYDNHQYEPPPPPPPPPQQQQQSREQADSQPSISGPRAHYDNHELLQDLVAASAGLCNLEHPNCAHCYQSLAPALQVYQQDYFSTSATMASATTAAATVEDAAAGDGDQVYAASSATHEPCLTF